MAKPFLTEDYASPSSIKPGTELGSELTRKPFAGPPVKHDDRQFVHFGVLNAGKQNKASLVTSIVVNVIIAICVIMIGLAAKQISETHRTTTTLVDPTILKPPPPPPPIVKPRVLPPVPKIVKVEPPKIVVPEVKVPVPAPAVVRMTQPVPAVAPAPPRRVIAPAAPAVVSLAHPQAAAVPNNDPHPSAIALGRPDNPIAPSNRPATSAINLGQRGMAGMPASNSGAGPAASHVTLGSGSAGSSSLTGNGTRAVAGVSLGVTGGTGPNSATGRVAGPVNLGVASATTAPRQAQASATTVHTGPKVIYKPRPEYTAEARSLHLEGTVSVKLRVSASGAVQVLGVINGLGHGLDQAAENAVRNTRFQPALDASGHPTDWEGVVNVAFQLAT